jgi:glycine cleavage system H protein
MHIQYTTSHEWIYLHGKKATVGISDYAQKELGEIVYIELPDIGQAIEMGELLAVVESTKAATDLYTPISGTIIEVNEALKKTPSLMNTSAEKDGWIAIIAPANDNLKKSKEFLSRESYLAFIG